MLGTRTSIQSGKVPEDHDHQVANIWADMIEEKGSFF